MIGMNWPSLALVALLWSYATIFGQEQPLAVVKLEAAVYPPMAFAARVSGDVVLNVTLASDGGHQWCHCRKRTADVETSCDQQVQHGHSFKRIWRIALAGTG